MPTNEVDEYLRQTRIHMDQTAMGKDEIGNLLLAVSDLTEAVTLLAKQLSSPRQNAEPALSSTGELDDKVLPACCCLCAEPAVIYDSGDSYCAQHYYEATGTRLDDKTPICEFCDRETCAKGDEPCDCACHIPLPRTGVRTRLRTAKPGSGRSSQSPDSQASQAQRAWAGGALL